MSRIDLWYSQEDKITDQNGQAFKSFLDDCHTKIKQESNTKYVNYDYNQKGFILRAGSKKSSNYSRVYRNQFQI